MTTFTKMFNICTEPIYRLPTCNIAGHFLACIEGVTGEGLGETKTHLVSLVLSLQDTLKHFSVETVSQRRFQRRKGQCTNVLLPARIWWEISTVTYHRGFEWWRDFPLLEILPINALEKLMITDIRVCSFFVTESLHWRSFKELQKRHQTKRKWVGKGLALK